MNRGRNHLLSYLLVSLNLASALWGLVFPEVYREPLIFPNGWSKATLAGIDLVSFMAFAGMALLLTKRSRGPRWEALWLGSLFFSAYSHSFQVFTTSLNGKFPLHLAAFVIAVCASLGATQRILLADPDSKPTVRRQKIAALWMVSLSVVLVGVWSVQWTRQLSAGFREAQLAAATQSIAALDLVLAFPAFLLVGIALWRGRFSDSPIPTAVNLAFGIYMAALAVATWTNRVAGTPDALRELPLWTGLAVASAICAVAMLPARANPPTRGPAAI